MNNTHFQSFIDDGCGRCERFKTPECKVHAWREPLIALRSLLLATELKEEMKWGFPTYTLAGKNVAQLATLKSHCTLSFFKGAAMQDPEGKLHAPGPNSRYARYLKFQKLDQVEKQEASITSYIQEAIRLEREGIEVQVDASKLEIPSELQEQLDLSPELAQAFQALTPGRQRSHVIHIAGAQKASTRERRVEKCVPKILASKGFNEY